jgi:hypothetical protein
VSSALQGLEFRFMAQSSGLRVKNLGSGFRVQDSKFWVQGSGSRV